MQKLSARVTDLLRRMTLQEKIGQLVQVLPNVIQENCSITMTGGDTNLKLTEEQKWMVGSVINCIDAEESHRLCDEYLRHNRLGIPLMFMMDVIHGFRTEFPVPLGLACSFDDSIIQQAGRIMSLEAAATGQNVTFAPMVDLSRDARWGRVVESAGEDPYLGSRVASAWVKGIQGENQQQLRQNGYMAACLKHFAGYGAVEGGREYEQTDMSEHRLREMYLTSFKSGIDAGAMMVMSGFCTFEGVPVTASKRLLRQILRKDLGFEGVVISDWNAIGEVLIHGAAENAADAARRSIEASTDIDMMSGYYLSSVEQLVNNGLLREELINEAVGRILTLKEKLGLFENPWQGMADKIKRESLMLCKEHRKKAYDAAVSSCVLLKNDNKVLPFSSETKKIAIIGPSGQSGTDLNGTWSGLAKTQDIVSLEDGIKRIVPHAEVRTVSGCDFYSGTEIQLEAAILAARWADTVVLAGGEQAYETGECQSHVHISLPDSQQRLISEVLKVNSNAAVVLFNGRPLVLGEIAETAPAILEAWFPGTEAGNAVAALLWGKESPRGRLAMSFPRNVGQYPLYYNRINTGRPYVEQGQSVSDVFGALDGMAVGYKDETILPLYPFGYGLSYTSFEYSAVSLSNDSMECNDCIEASVIVRNIGDVAGYETVQMYLRDMCSSVTRPILELKDYKKIYLKPGEFERVTFNINKSLLGYWNEDMKFVYEPGEFHVMIGSDSKHWNWASFRLQ